MKIIRSQTSHFQGFTLIELLVVIAIIAILAAILFPVFAKVREKARQTSCASNMKQMGLAFQQYTQDYDETFPAGYVTGAAGTGSQKIPAGDPGGIDPYKAQGWQWGQQVYSYVKSKGVYKCPDDSTQSSQSYLFNLNLGGKSNARLSAPASTVCLSEFSCPYQAVSAGGGTDALDPSSFDDASIAGWGWKITDYTDDTIGVASGEGGHYSPGTLPRHGVGINYLAADGHVKFLNPIKVSNGPDATKSGCIQHNNYDPTCNSANGYSASSTDTLKLTDGTTPVTLTYSPT